MILGDLKPIHFGLDYIYQQGRRAAPVVTEQLQLSVQTAETDSFGSTKLRLLLTSGLPGPQIRQMLSVASDYANHIMNEMFGQAIRAT